MEAHAQLAVAGPIQAEPTVNYENETETIAAWIRGDKRAYEALVRRHMADAFLVAYGYTGNAEDARDLSQEAFIKAYLARGRFDATRPFYPWFHRILRNHCLNFVQRGRRNLSIDADDFHREIPSPRPNALDDIEQEERKRIVHAAIARLSDDHRDIIVLKTFRDLSYQEISEALEIPIGTVMSRLFYARQALRVLIEEIERTGLGEPNDREAV
jgi:RNA polymerase sigma-70 factor (ECF subfamily)